MPLETRELLARLIKCEAGGEGDDGMRAVASVIVNRTNIPYGGFFRVSQGGNIRNCGYLRCGKRLYGRRSSYRRQEIRA